MFSNQSIVLEKRDIFSIPLCDSNFDFLSIVSKETKQFCKEQGIDVDRIYMVQIYEADLKEPTEKISSHSDTTLQVYERDGKYEAVLFLESRIDCD